jgi:ABC-type Zn uptake system ZnuABC Zn-binding protein ZnuA
MAEHGVSKQVRRGWIAWSGLTFVRVLMGSTKFRLFSVAAAALLLFTSACERDTGEVDGRLKVVVTTNIVGDVVGVIGGDLIDLKVLLPVNSDPHSFEPTPRDVVAITDADLIFTSGAGLEGFLDPLLETASGEAELVSLSDDIELLVVETDHEGDLHGDGDEGGDPHVWFDPSNVIIWAETVSRVLRTYDPNNADIYEDRTGKYISDLKSLDNWIDDQVSQIPISDRQLVSDHASFGYFARRYGFMQVGAVFPAFSTMSEPSAQDLSNLEDLISSNEVNAIFVGENVNPDLSRQIAMDTGVNLVFLYTGSLSDEDGGAPTYIEMMRYNVTTIVEALR